MATLKKTVSDFLKACTWSGSAWLFTLCAILIIVGSIYVATHKYFHDKGREYVTLDKTQIYKDHEYKFNELVEMDMDATHDDQISLIDDLCDKFILDSAKPEDSLSNQFVRGNSQTGNGYLGHPTYYEAKQRWNQ